MNSLLFSHIHFPNLPWQSHEVQEMEELLKYMGEKKECGIKRKREEGKKITAIHANNRNCVSLYHNRLLPFSFSCHLADVLFGGYKNVEN